MEKNKFIEKILDSRESLTYDCAVMFSGGKDSSYLLYLLKEVYKKKIIAVSIDNGFEHEKTWTNVKEVTEKLDVPHIILTPPKNYFKLLYETAIKEYKLFSSLNDSNHVCLLCGFLIWGCVANFAFENNIPFVISGLDPMQMHIDDMEEKIKDIYTNKIYEKKCRLLTVKSIELHRKTKTYAMNEEYKNFLEKMYTIPKNVTTIYPFLYLDYNVEYIKEILAHSIQWEPSIDVDIKSYHSSGCKVVDVLFQIEKLGIVKPKEILYIKKLVKKGALSKQALSQLGFLSCNCINLGHSIYNELDIKQFILQKCIQNKVKYENV